MINKETLKKNKNRIIAGGALILMVGTPILSMLASNANHLLTHRQKLLLKNLKQKNLIWTL